MRLTLAENFRAIFYAPFYALKALRLAEAEGLEVTWLPPGAPGGAIDDIKRGAVDLTWGGPMRVMKDHDTAPADGASLVGFGEVVARDPFCLIGRADAPSFDLRSLARLRLGVVSEVPTPWLCLQADLRDAGVDIDAMKLTRGLTMPEQLQALTAGTIDVAQCFEPFVSQTLAQAGGMVHAASGRGPVVYTTFICSRDGLVRHHDAFRRLERALVKLYDWVGANGPDELARLTAVFFPDVAPELYRRSVARYCAEGVWSRSPAVSRQGFERLEYSLFSGGFIRTRMAYADCVHVFDGA